LKHRKALPGLITIVFGLFLLVDCGTSAPALPTAGPTRYPTVYGMDELPVRPVVYEIPGMDEAIVRKDVTYKTTPSHEFKMDVYYPADLQSGSRWPVVILTLWGDGAKVKDYQSSTSWGRLLAASGVAAVAANWDPYEASTEDLVQYVRNHAEALNIDKDRICLFGLSAGASYSVAAGISGTPDYVRCMVAYYGLMGLPLSKLRGEKAKEVAPLLIAKAERDDIVPATSIDAFVREATSRGVNVTLLTHPSGVHCFDILNDDDQSREVIKKTLEFIQVHCGAP